MTMKTGKEVSDAAKYRKKPVVISAVQLTKDSMRECVEFIGRDKFSAGGHDPSWIKIITLEGDMLAREGDWIIKGVKGEFYPCKPDIFEQTYEPEHAELASIVNQACREAIANARNELNECKSILCDMVFQHCSDSNGIIDHGCLSSNEDAVEYLVKAGDLEPIKGRLCALKKGPNHV